ncbi:putative Ig domain-containing protein [Paenarthrobacter sp. RAF54_2]|uniref:putative Ig domain-containing protein n=1 Tax=Paenarthrobacter sp. RAF54_2 TaxID=3233061 RepID=UPI003F943736
MAGRHGYAGKSLRFSLAVLLVGGFAGGLALQGAEPGTAADLPAPSSVPTPNPAATPSASPTASASPSPSASPSASATNTPSPTPTASPTETQPPAVEKVAVEAAAPLSVRLSEDRAFVGKPFEAELQVTGGTGPYTATATDIPAGLVFDPVTLSFSGTPTELYSPSLTVTVSDSSDPRQTLTEQIYIDIKSYYPPSVYVSDGELLPGMGTFDDGVVGWYYQEFLDYYGLDRANTSISIVSGQLPPGLELRESSVSGVPTTPGTYGFTLHIQDRFGFSDKTSRIIVHALGMQTTGFDVPPAVLGEPYAARIAQATGGVAPYVYGYSTRRYFAGGLSSSDPSPEGLTVDANGFLTGIPTRVGSFRIAVWVRDADQLTQRIFWTTVTVLETRPPVVEQPPAVSPPAAVEAPAAPAPPAAVTPAGAVASTSGAELAVTGLQSGSLKTTLGAAVGLLVVGAALIVLNSLRRRRSSPV